MKRMVPLFGFLLLFSLITACGLLLDQNSYTPAPALPAAASAIPKENIIPTAAHTLLFRDDFEGQLGEGWRWLGEDASHWNLTDAPGFMRIFAQGTNINSDGIPINFLVRDVPDEDFEIETYVKFEPTSNFQFAGLLVYEEQGRALGFGRAFAECNSYKYCNGNALYFDNPTQTNAPNFVTPTDSNSRAFLLMRRKGNSYSAYYSTNGLEWVQIGVHTSGISPRYVGLIAGQAYEEERPADFDYFELQVLP